MPGIFYSSDFGSSSSLSVFRDPVAYAAASVFLLTTATQVWPNTFLDPFFRGKIYFSYPAQRLMLPGLGIPFSGYCLSSNLLQDGELVRGHSLSLLTCMYMTLWSLPSHKLTMWYTSIGLSAIMLGYFYNYKALVLYTEGAPWWTEQDWREIIGDKRKHETVA